MPQSHTDKIRVKGASHAPTSAALAAVSAALMEGPAPGVLANVRQCGNGEGQQQQQQQRILPVYQGADIIVSPELRQAKRRPAEAAACQNMLPPCPLPVLLKPDILMCVQGPVCTRAENIHVHKDLARHPLR
jgi:hypothetical protein